MLADAVFDAASDITIATAVKSIVSDSVDCAGSHDVIPRPIASARPGGERQLPHRQAAAEQQDDAPVDPRPPLPTSA